MPFFSIKVNQSLNCSIFFGQVDLSARELLLCRLSLRFVSGIFDEYFGAFCIMEALFD